MESVFVVEGTNKKKTRTYIISAFLNIFLPIGAVNYEVRMKMRRTLLKQSPPACVATEATWNNINTESKIK